MENAESQQSENCIFNGNPFREFASKKFKVFYINYITNFIKIMMRSEKHKNINVILMLFC